MQDIVFLGIFDKIANWIMSGITKVLTWLVSNVIAPVCSVVWENAVKYIVEFVGEIVATFVYKLYAFALSIMYAIENAVYSFAGATNVNYQGKQDNIISIIFQQPSVKTAFWYITALAVVLLFIFTIITVIKTTLDFGYDGRKNMGTIMTQFITSAITFLILPAFCYGLIDLTSRVMNALFVATSMGGTNSLTDNLFLLSVKSSVGDTSLKYPITETDYNGLLGQIQANKMFWYNLSDVLPYIHRATNVDFVIGIIGVLILIINLLSMAGTFIQRVIEVIVLYIVSPIFVATIPLDDGERFGRWRRTFIGRLCMGVGMIVALNVVMMILCIVISGSDGYTISFTEEVSYTSDVVRAAANKSVDIILKLIFIVGSILAVKNLGSTITSIIDQEAGFAERASMHENSERLKNLPGTIAGAVGAAKFAAGYVNKMMNKESRDSIIKGSVSRGFSGEVANSREQAFADMIKRQNSNNASKAAFTNRGSKYSALKGQIARGNKALSDFKNLKTHGERERFMADFNRNGGINSLKVDSSKFGKSDMTNMRERSALSNLDKRIENARANKNKFQKNSEGWKKFDNQLNSLSRLRNQFDMLNTHKEREAFIKSHSEFGSINKMNSVEQSVANKLSKRVAEAKEARDKMPEGSAEWKKADENYQKLLQKQTQFNSAESHSERSKFAEENIEASAETFSNKEKKALRNIYDKKRRAIGYRNMFSEGSEGWNIFNKQIEDMDKLADKFNSMGTREERGKLIDSNPIFNDETSMSLSNSKHIKNLDKNINRVAGIRNKYKQGSQEWNKFNNELGSLVMAKAGFEAINSNEGRESFVMSNSDAFIDNTSDKENKAVQNLNARKLTALNNRNMFQKGSSEWNIYNSRYEQLENIGTQMQSISLRSDREAFIEQHSEFSTFGSVSESDSNRNALNANLSRAIQNRDRHKVNSPKWNQCNEEVKRIALARAEYDSMSGKEERNAFVQGNSAVFTDNMSDDDGYRQIEQAYSSWNALSMYANDEQTREHAYKMAKAYAGYSEQYQRAGNAEARSAVLSNMTDFENHSVEVQGIAVTPKEYSGMSAVMATGNEKVIKNYVNSQSHRERAEILKGVEKGEYERFEIASSNEENYASQLLETGNKYGEMAKTERNPDTKKQYEAMERFLYEAGGRYSELATHSQREAFAEYVTGEILQSGIDNNDISMPVVEPPEITEKENNFISKLSDEERREFVSLGSHRSRYKYMDNYYALSQDTLEFTQDEENEFNSYFSGSSDTEFERTAQYRTAYIAAESHEVRKQVMLDYADYVEKAPDFEMPGKWNEINTSGLSDIFTTYGEEPHTQAEEEAAADNEAKEERIETLDEIVSKAKTRPRRNSMPSKKTNKDFFRERNSNNKPGGHK